MLPIKRILFPTDFSNVSQHALHLACALARDYGADLYLFHVALPATAYVPEMIVLEEVPVTAARQQLAKLAAVLKGFVVHQHVVEGVPADEILRYGKEIGCDLILMGTHGRSGIGRLLMGSVAEQVVRHAHCPVVCVKHPHAVSAKVAAGEPAVAEPASAPT